MFTCAACNITQEDVLNLTCEIVKIRSTEMGQTEKVKTYLVCPGRITIKVSAAQKQYRTLNTFKFTLHTTGAPI